MFSMLLESRRSLLVAPVVALLATGCGSDDLSSIGGPNGQVVASVAFDNWTPGPNDTCTPADHNKYSAVGPDGKIYPTWHPPTDPQSGCRFGHEHGRNPAGSNLIGDWGPLLFGYANEQLDEYDPSMRRHEDHVGHKVDWENDFDVSFGDGAAAKLLSMRCDALIKMHQGSHSKDAFTNNMHEVIYHLRCSDGTEMHITALTAIGTPGEFVANCDDRHIVVGVAAPANSPSGGGQRIIPTRDCLEAGHSARESWQISQSVRTVDGRRLAHFNPYFNVHQPSRHYDPSKADLTGRPIELCYLGLSSGIAGMCDEATNGGSVMLAYDNPQSPFDGANRDFDINSNDISNEGGPEVWYSDPLGRNARQQPFRGSIKQWIASIDNERNIDDHFPSIGRNRTYKGPGVHSPN